VRGDDGWAWLWDVTGRNYRAGAIGVLFGGDPLRELEDVPDYVTATNAATSPFAVPRYITAMMPEDGGQGTSRGSVRLMTRWRKRY